MYDVQLQYGSGSVSLRAPARLVAGEWSLDRVAKARAHRTARDATDAHGGQVSRNVASFEAARDELARAGFDAAIRTRRLGLLVSDGTRAWDPAAFFGVLGADLEAAGALDVFLCTGTHVPSTPENERLAGAVRAQLDKLAVSSRLFVHDARADEHRVIGTTSRGTRVEIMARADACDAFLVASDMKPHYFAGYSNAVKYFVPGLATLETARGNHSLALEEEAVFGRHPWHPDSERRSNPLAQDMVEAFELFVRDRPCFALTSVTSTVELLWAGGGVIRDAVARGMRAVDELTSIEVEPVRFLVVSAGGAPHDESLYTVQRALELSREAVLPGGEVLFLAQCPNGIGPPRARENFFEPLTQPLEDIAATRREDYVLYSHKPVKFARLLARLDALHLYSDLDPDDVRRIHMHPVDDPQHVVDGWVDRAAPDDRIAFLCDGSKLSIYVPMP